MRRDYFYLAYLWIYRNYDCLNIQSIFLIGSKSIGMYGGFETFVYKLLEYHKNNNRLNTIVDLLLSF